MIRKLFFAVVLAFSLNAFSQTEPVATYDGGLYFIPAKLTLQNAAYLYSYNNNHDAGKTWFTVFDSELNVVRQAEIEAEVLNYRTRTVVSKRRYFGGSPTKTSVSGDGYFLDGWTEVSDTIEDQSYRNQDIKTLEVYEDDNSYHSRYMILSQTLFNADGDFEFMRPHYEVMPLTYCADDDKSQGYVSMEKPSVGGEEFDYYETDYDSELHGYVLTLYRVKVYGGVKMTGTDIITLDGEVKKSLDGLTGFQSVVAISGQYYVSAYDGTTSKYGLYRIATATTSISKVAELTGETGDNRTYNLSGIAVAPDTKGVVVRNGRTFINR